MAFNLRRLFLSWPTLRGPSAPPARPASESASTPPQAANAGPTVPPRAHGSAALPPAFFRLTVSWLLLLLLGGVEFGASFLQFAPALRPLLMIAAILMIAIVAVSFMEVGKGPTIVRGFAVVAVFWLLVLLGLGSMDPLTRTDYLVPHVKVE